MYTIFKLRSLFQFYFNVTYMNVTNANAIVAYGMKANESSPQNSTPAMHKMMETEDVSTCTWKQRAKY